MVSWARGPDHDSFSFCPPRFSAPGCFHLSLGFTLFQDHGFLPAVVLGPCSFLPRPLSAPHCLTPPSLPKRVMMLSKKHVCENPALNDFLAQTREVNDLQHCFWISLTDRSLLSVSIPCKSLPSILWLPFPWSSSCPFLLSAKDKGG